MDDIEYEMTEWFPKKIKPVRAGVYMVKTAGKNSYTYQSKWTGSRWISAWQEDTPETDEIKIKEWQGLAKDPDAEVEGPAPFPAEAAKGLAPMLDEFTFEQGIAELEKAVEELGKEIGAESVSTTGKSWPF